MNKALNQMRHALGTTVLALCMLALAGGTSPILAQETQRFDLGDFELESGEVIEGGFLTYVTHGELNEARDNAILVLPSLMANHTRPPIDRPTTANSPSSSNWVTAIWENHRRAIMADFDATEGNEPASDTGFRAAISSLMVWVRHWHWMDEEFAEDNQAVIEWLEGLEDSLSTAWDPINYVYQTRAEELHNIAEAPGMGGDYEEALRTIQARTLLMPGTYDILHPVDDSRRAAELIPNARFVEIESPIGHLGGGGTLEEDRDLMNREIAAFLDEVAESTR